VNAGAAAGQRAIKVFERCLAVTARREGSVVHVTMALGGTGG